MTTLETMPDDWSRVLAVAAHPDDIAYAAGAAVATWIAGGKQVRYVLATRGEAGISGLAPEQAKPLREAEERLSAAAVGVTDVHFLDHPDGVIGDERALRRDFSAAIREYRPDLVVTINHRDVWPGNNWNTADHRIVGRAVLDAVIDAGNEHLFGGDGREPWEGVHWQAVAGSPLATHALDVTGSEEKAMASVLAHRAYLAALTDQSPADYVRGFLRRNTGAVAANFGGRPGVAFELFRRDPYRVRDGLTHYR